MGIMFDYDDLCTCLTTITPVELKGMGLLREQPHFISGTAHIPREVLIEAVTEIVAYTGRCATAARQLAGLASIPLLNISVMEFGL